MKCAVLYDWVEVWGNNLRLEERPIPEPKEGEALVKVKACGVGVAVSHFLTGEDTRDKKLLPRIPGHEIAGEIVKIGHATQNHRTGDKVLVYVYLHCGKCRFCVQGLFALCLSSGFVGIDIDGGYAEYVVVPLSNLLPLPEGVSFKEASVISGAIATCVHVMGNRATVRPTDNVLIIGAAGGVGVHAVQVAKAYGARVIGVDIDDEKLEAISKLGADEVINSRNKPIADTVRKFTSQRGVDAVVDFVGTPETFREGCNSLARQGRLVVLTQHQGKLELSPTQMVDEEITVIGSRYATKEEFMRASEMVRVGLVKPIVTRTSDLAHVEDLHKEISQGKLLGRAALVFE